MLGHMAALLHGLYQLNGLGHGLAREHLAQHMPSAFKQTYREHGVLVRVVGEHDGIHVMPEKVLKILIQRYAEPGLFCGVAGFF